MRVAIVHSFYTEQFPSGENSVVRQQAEALDRAGLSVATISASTDTLSRTKSYKIISAYQAATAGGRSPMQSLTQFQPDLIHVHNLLPNFGTRWLRQVQVPVVLTLHNHRLVCANGLLRRRGEACTDCVGSSPLPSVVHRCYRGSLPGSVSVASGMARRRRDILSSLSAVVTLSEDFLKVAESYLPGDVERFVIPNFLPATAGVVTQTSELPCRSLYVGRLSEEKGILELVQMWPHDRPLTIVGDGPRRSAVTELARERPNISLLGNLDAKSVAKVMTRHTELIFPSLTLEPSSMTVIEALSLGLPVIAHQDNSVAPRASTHGFGLSFRDRSSLLHAIEQVDAHHPDFSRRAKEYFKSHHSEQAWLEKILDCYDTVLRKRASVPLNE